MKVLITDAHWRKSLAAVRSLGKKGIEVTAGESCRIATSLFSKYCTRRIIYPSPFSNPDGFITFLLDTLKKTRYDCLLPMEEDTLLLVAKYREEISKLTYILVPEYHRLTFVRDKGTMLRHALQSGIPCPKTYFIKELREIDAVAEGAEYPLVIKPRVSSGSRGICYVSCREELVPKYREVHERYNYPLIQEYIPSRSGGFGLAALFSENSQLKAAFVHKRLREYPVSGGPSTLRESVYHEEIKTLGIKLLQSLHWVGVAMVEFKVDSRDNRPKLMEINPRFWGSLVLAVAAGVDFPYLICKMALGEDVEPVHNYQIGKKARWLLPGDMMHFFSMLRQGHITRGFFKFFDGATTYDIISMDDPLPTVGRILSLFTLLYDNDMKRVLRDR